MSYSAQEPLIKQALSILAQIMGPCTEEQQMLTLLDDIVAVLEEISAQEIELGEETLYIYQEFNQLLRVRKADDIAQYVRITSPQLGSDIPRYCNISHVFDYFLEVVGILKRYQRRQTLGDRASDLLNAHDCLENMRKDLEADMTRRSRQKAYAIELPEDAILSLIQQRWSDIVGRELQ